MKIQMNPAKVDQIQTKYIITDNKSVKSTMERMVDLKKGDIIQGVSIITHGNMSNDSGSQYLVFRNKEGNEFRIQIGFRGFVPFYEEYKSEVTSNKNIVPQTFLQKHKNHLLIFGAFFLGYFAYKKFNK